MHNHLGSGAGRVLGRLLAKQLAQRLAIVLAAGLMQSCQTPTNSAEATRALILHQLSGPLNQTDVISTANSCQGSAGSIERPLALEAPGWVLAQSDVYLDRLHYALQGEPSPRDHYVFLGGIERYFVYQHNQHDCWAAVFEMARKWNRYFNLNQDQILHFAQAQCSNLSSQKIGANLYQITYVIERLDDIFGGPPLNDTLFCADSDCIINALSSGEPIIMLKGDHATLIVGVDYFLDSSEKILTIQSIDVLDPADKNMPLETKSPGVLFAADALLAY